MKIVVLLVIIAFAYAQKIKIGEKPPIVTLDGENGGKVNGEKFSTAELQGKVFYVVYVDPDYRELNEEFNEKLRSKNYPLDKYGSVAITNMGATWLPNFILEEILQSKQKKYPRTTFVMDKNKVFVKEWGLADDNYNVLVLDKYGKVLFYKVGKLSPDDENKIISIIEDEMKKN